MLNALIELARPALLALDPERAHELTLTTLEKGLYPRPSGPDPLELRVSVMGLELPNPIGIAPGFDKDARVPDAVLGLGFGFAEIGTVTPLAQAGNPRPRVFRTAQEAEISYEAGVVKLHDLAEYRPMGREGGHVLTTVGRIIYNDRIERSLQEALGASFDVADYPFVNQPVRKRDTVKIIAALGGMKGDA